MTAPTFLCDTILQDIRHSWSMGVYLPRVLNGEIVRSRREMVQPSDLSPSRPPALPLFTPGIARSSGYTAHTPPPSWRSGRRSPWGRLGRIRSNWRDYLP